MTAAGGEVEPYWSLYRQHLQASSAAQEPRPKSHVAEILAPLLIGHVDPQELTLTPPLPLPLPLPLPHPYPYPYPYPYP